MYFGVVYKALFCRTLLVPRETAAVSVHVLCAPLTTIHEFTVSLRRVRVCLAARLEHTTFRSRILHCTTELSPLPGVAAITDLITLPVLCGVVFFVLLTAQSLWKSGHVTFNLRSDLSAFCSLARETHADESVQVSNRKK